MKNNNNKRREFVKNSTKLALASVAVGAGISPLLAKDSSKDSNKISKNKGAKMSSVKHISVSGAIGQMQKEWATQPLCVSAMSSKFQGKVAGIGTLTFHTKS